MADQSKAVYFLTGANRGIGLGIAKEWLARPNTIVIAGVRDPSHPSVNDIHALPKASGTSLIIVKLEHASTTDADDVVQELQTKHNISHVDIVFPQAGILGIWNKAIDLSPETVNETIDINVYAPLRILRAFTPLLKKAANPRFAGMASYSVFSFLREYQGDNNGYHVSKVLLGAVTSRVHAQEKWLTSFIISPGWVKTDMGRTGGDPPLTVEESAGGCVKVLEEATREKVGGRQINYTGEELPWGA